MNPQSPAMDNHKMSDAVVLRQSRKLDHINLCLQASDGPGTTGFEDISLIHNCLPDLDLSSINLGTSAFGLNISPIILNALTGGTPDVTELNRQLAYAARVCDIPMAVGSQTAAIEDASVRESFAVVRKEHPSGIIIANVGANSTPQAAFKAVDMLKADALQIHLNVAQELAMPEGDRNFRGYANNIKQIVKTLTLPVIVKEVGFGMARQQVLELAAIGVAAIDVGGRGGTNFAAIEAARGLEPENGFLNSWGISTACSLIEAVTTCKANIDIIASGGIREASDIAKALALGATAVGIAAPYLQILISQGVDALISYIKKQQYGLQTMLLLTGADSIRSLQTKPVVITGYTSQWLQARGIDFSKFATR